MMLEGCYRTNINKTDMIGATLGTPIFTHCLIISNAKDLANCYIKLKKNDEANISKIKKMYSLVNSNNKKIFSSF